MTLDCPSGYVCASSQACDRKLCLNAGTCIGSGGFDTLKTAPGTPSGGFPPTVTPASGPKSGWQLSFEQLDAYLANDFSLPKDWYMVYDGKRTVNTRCIGVGELEFATIKSFPKDSLLTFSTQILSQTRSPDSCCLALFEGTECNPGLTNLRHSFFCNGVTSYKIPFSAQAWMVYGCTGL